jgi:hypothetical protein
LVGDEVDLFDNVVANNIIDCDEHTSKPLKDMWGGGNLCDSIMVNNVFRNGGGSGLCVIRTSKRLICASKYIMELLQVFLWKQALRQPLQITW